MSDEFDLNHALGWAQAWLDDPGAPPPGAGNSADEIATTFARAALGFASERDTLLVVVRAARTWRIASVGSSLEMELADDAFCRVIDAHAKAST